MQTDIQPGASSDTHVSIIPQTAGETAQGVLVCIGLCTAGRPTQLSKCLASLVLQRAPRDYSYLFIVVDNNPEPGAQPLVDAAAVHSRFPFRYLHETHRGISFARNRVLEEALAEGADWIAFIDDDETAPPNWLVKMLAACRRHKADVLQGPVIPSYPDPMPFWGIPKEPELREGEVMKFAATGNVLFKASLIKPDGMDLRFDEAMALSGGEDTDFFLRAEHAGARIVYSTKPAVAEEVPPERLTFARQMRLAFRTGANDVYLKRKLYGSVRIFLRRMPQILIRLLRGAGQLAVSPLLAGYDETLFKRTALDGGWKFFKSLGVLAGLTGFRPGAYRRIDGY